MSITEDDIKQAEHYGTLGPAYFTARRIAEELMAGSEAEPLKKVAAKASEMVRDELYEYVETHMLMDLESNLQGRIVRIVDDTVLALLTGDEWAMKRYPYHAYGDGERVRAVVCKHGGETLMTLRIEDLEKELARVNEQLKWYTQR